MQNFKEGDTVTFIPLTANHNINHPDCEIGKITRAETVGNELNQRVHVSFKGGTGIPIPAKQLVLHPRNADNSLAPAKIETRVQVY